MAKELIKIEITNAINNGFVGQIMDLIQEIGEETIKNFRASFADIHIAIGELINENVIKCEADSLGFVYMGV
jgi:hypothetical protein